MNLQIFTLCNQPDHQPKHQIKKPAENRLTFYNYMKSNNVKNVLKTTATASLACSLTYPTLAHGEGDDHELDDLGTTTHVGRRAPQSKDKTTSNLLTIIPDELPDIGTNSLTNSLRHHPGVLVSSGGQQGTIQSVRVRGLRSEDTKIRVDGVNISNRLSNSTLFVGNFGLAGLSKAELLKGAQSSLYGASATGGVLNLETSIDNNQLFNNSFRVEAGSFNSLLLSYEHGGTLDKAGKLSYKAFSSFSTTDNDTFSDNSEIPGFDNDSVTYSSGLRLNYEHNERLSFGLTFRQVDIDVETPQFSITESEFLLGSVYADLNVTDNWNSKLTFTYLSENTDFNFTPVTTDYDQFAFIWENNLQYSDNGSLSFGAEYENNDLTNFNSSGGVKDHYSALYAHHAYEINQLTIDAGVRYEDYQSFGNQTTWQAGLLYDSVETGTKLRGNIATGFTAPNFLQIFGSPGGVFNGGFIGAPVPANLGLDPETSFGFDLGIDQKIGNQTLSISYFETDIEDVIESPFLQQSFNAPGKQKANGIEATLIGTIHDKLKYNANYTWLDNSIDGQPQHTANLSFIYSPIRDLDLALSAQYLDNRTFGGNPLDDAFVLNLSASYQITEHIRANARIENLTDTEYSLGNFGSGDFQTDSPARRLGAFGGITIEW